MTGAYDVDLDRNAANFRPLTPLGFLERAASVFPDRIAIVHGALRRDYSAFYARARVYEEQGELKQALAGYEEAAKLAPNNKTIPKRIAEVKQKLRQ